MILKTKKKKILKFSNAEEKINQPLKPDEIEYQKYQNLNYVDIKEKKLTKIIGASVTY